MTTPTFDTDLTLPGAVLRSLREEPAARALLADHPSPTPGQVALVLRALADFSHNARMVTAASRLADDPGAGLARYLTDLAGHLAAHGAAQVYDPLFWLFHRPVTHRVMRRVTTIDATDLAEGESRPTARQAAAVVLVLGIAADGAVPRHIAHGGPSRPAWLVAARAGLVLHQLADALPPSAADQG